MPNWCRYLLITTVLVVAGSGGIYAALHVLGHDKQQVDVIRPADPGSKDAQVIETFHYPAAFSKALAHDPQAGQKVFHAYCASCHGKHAVIPVNAPVIGDKQIWQARRKMGMDNLLKLSLNGFGRMPSRGGCFECTDKQIKLAIQYILDKSK